MDIFPCLFITLDPVTLVCLYWVLTGSGRWGRYFLKFAFNFRKLGVPLTLGEYTIEPNTTYVLGKNMIVVLNKNDNIQK